MLMRTNDRVFTVTVKLPKNPNHDPHNKVTGVCPLSEDFGAADCTDVTGEHHSITLVTSDKWDATKMKEFFVGKGYHVTRIEGSLQ